MLGASALRFANRQRRLREQARKRAIEREKRDRENQNRKTSRRDNSVGMLHIALCLLVFGLSLLCTDFLPDNIVTWRGKFWWREIKPTGIFLATLGLFLIALNCMIATYEEANLNENIQRNRWRNEQHLKNVQIGFGMGYPRLFDRRRRDLGSNDVPVVHRPIVNLENIAEEDQQTSDEYFETSGEDNVS